MISSTSEWRRERKNLVNQEKQQKLSSKLNTERKCFKKKKKESQEPVGIRQDEQMFTSSESQEKRKRKRLKKIQIYNG